MATIKIPTPLRVYTNNTAQVTVGGETIGAALNDLISQFPELETHLFKDGELRNFVNVFIGDEDARFLQGMETSIDGDTALRIIPSIAGGQ